MAILTINFDEDDHKAFNWMIETFRDSLENGGWRIPEELNDDVMRLIRTIHESVRSWNVNDPIISENSENIETINQFVEEGDDFMS